MKKVLFAALLFAFPLVARAQFNPSTDGGALAVMRGQAANITTGAWIDLRGFTGVAVQAWDTNANATAVMNVVVSCRLSSDGPAATCATISLVGSSTNPVPWVGLGVSYVRIDVSGYSAGAASVDVLRLHQ